MDRLTRVIAACAGLLIGLWAIWSFVILEINPIKWEVGARMALMWFWVAFCIPVTVFTMTSKGRHRG